MKHEPRLFRSVDLLPRYYVITALRRSAVIAVQSNGFAIDRFFFFFLASLLNSLYFKEYYPSTVPLYKRIQPSTPWHTQQRQLLSVPLPPLPHANSSARQPQPQPQPPILHSLTTCPHLCHHHYPFVGCVPRLVVGSYHHRLPR